MYMLRVPIAPHVSHVREPELNKAWSGRADVFTAIIIYYYYYLVGAAAPNKARALKTTTHFCGKSGCVLVTDMQTPPPSSEVVETL